MACTVLIDIGIVRVDRYHYWLCLASLGMLLSYCHCCFCCWIWVCWCCMQWVQLVSLLQVHTGQATVDSTRCHFELGGHVTAASSHMKSSGTFLNYGGMYPSVAGVFVGS